VSALVHLASRSGPRTSSRPHVSKHEPSAHPLKARALSPDVAPLEPLSVLSATSRLRPQRRRNATCMPREPSEEDTQPDLEPCDRLLVADGVTT
jgi:hypothetical protein